MSLPRMLLLVALGGLVVAVLLWGAVALAYGGGDLVALQVVCSAAVGAVVCSRSRMHEVGESVFDRACTYRSGPMSPEEAAEIVAHNRKMSPDVDHWIEPGGGDVVGVDPARGADGTGTVLLHNGKPFAGVAAITYGDSMAAAYQPLVDEGWQTIAPHLPAPRLTFTAQLEAVGEAARKVSEVMGEKWEAITAAISETIAGSCGFLAGDPCAGAVYPSGGLGKRGKKRPGQWGWRARMLRARRLDRAEQRRADEWQRRESLRGKPAGWRAANRLFARLVLETQARANYGIEPLPGEFTQTLRARVYRAQCRAYAPEPFTREDIATLSGGVVEVDHATATVRITMPARTSAERCEEVRADIAERMPPYVAVEVVCAAS